uniref:HAT C-terminal dimerisation domain-containing protein n=1 Tax=Schizaphis graminum TaxID=13262 RepID=A0A2S2PB42_SCHGA
MKQREVLLLKNPVFLAAIFLDPRYQCMLNETDKNTGINHLIKTWSFMIQIQDNVCQTDVDNSVIASVNVDTPDNTTETTDGFELFLSSQSSVSSNRSDTNIINDISVSLHNFKDVERLHYKTNILAFWESQKHDKSDLYKLANIVLAVPATQVSVERSFSGIKFILSDLRTSLSANLLDAIMIVRSNTKFNKV